MKISTRIEQLISEAVQKDVHEINFFPGDTAEQEVRILFKDKAETFHSDIDAGIYQQIVRYSQLKAHTEYKSPSAQEGTYKLKLERLTLNVKVTTIPVMYECVALVLTF